MKIVCAWCKKSRRHQAFGLCRLCYSRVYWNIVKRRSKYRTWQMPKLKGFEIAYIAGIIDGEGCIKLYPKSSPTCSLTIANNEKKLLDWILEKLNCGKVYIHKLPPERLTHQIQYQLRIASKLQIKQILETIKKYLIIKETKAQTMLDYIKEHPYRNFGIEGCPNEVIRMFREKYESKRK